MPKTARRDRIPSPPHPPKMGFSPMAAPRRRFVTIDRVEQTGWQQTDTQREQNTLIAYYSDGTWSTRTVRMRYKDGVREKIMETALDQNATQAQADEAQRKLTAFMCARDRLVEDARRELRAGYPKAVPA